MGVLLLPPEVVPVEGPLVFLAGPIQGAPDWQAEAALWFAAHAPALAVASPRRRDRSRRVDYAAQVDWERLPPGEGECLSPLPEAGRGRGGLIQAL